MIEEQKPVIHIQTTEYVEVTLKTILEYYKKDFKPKGNQAKIIYSEEFIDNSRGIVLFKFLIDRIEK